MIPPSQAIAERRACLEAADPDAVLETAADLAGRLADGDVPNQVPATRTVLRDLITAEPAAAPAVLEPLSESVTTGIEPPNRIYHIQTAGAAFDIVRAVPAAADEVVPLLRAVDGIGFHEEEVSEVLLAAASANPEMLADGFDLLTDDDEPFCSHVSRGEALSRAAATDSDALADPVGRLGQRVRSPTADRVAAAERLGAVGLVAPDLVAPAVPGLVYAVDDGGADLRAASVRALGLVAGADERYDSHYGVPDDGWEGVVETVGPTLTDPEPAVRRAAAVALKRTVAGDPTRAERVVGVLADALTTGPETRREDPVQALLTALETVSRSAPIPGEAADVLVDLATPEEGLDAAAGTDAGDGAVGADAADGGAVVTDNTSGAVDGADGDGADGTDISAETERAAAALLASVDGDGAVRAAALRLLGRVEGATGRDRVVAALRAGMAADIEDVRTAAVQGAGDAVARGAVGVPAGDDRGGDGGASDGAAGGDPSAADVLVPALVEATDDWFEAVREAAIAALGRTDASEVVTAGLERGVRDPEGADAAAEAACRLDAAPVVDTLVDAFCEACSSLGAAAEGDAAGPEATGADSDGADGEESDDGSEPAAVDEVAAFTDALETVAEDAPALLAPHVGALTSAVLGTPFDEFAGVLVETPFGGEFPSPERTFATAVHAVAETDPSAVAPHADGLRDHLLATMSGATPHAGLLLDALLAADAADAALVEQVVEQAEIAPLDQAAARLSERNPVLALRVVSALDTRVIGDECCRWAHQLPGIATADVRVHAPAVGLARDAIGADDDWVRWDGAAALAAVAEAAPHRAAGTVSALRDGLDDWNRHVRESAVRALGRLGDETVRADLEPLVASPVADIRAAATTALERLEEPVGPPTPGEDAVPDHVAGAWRYLLADDIDAAHLEPVAGPATEADGADGATDPEARERVVAVALAGLRHPDASVRERADALLADLGRAAATATDPARGGGTVPSWLYRSERAVERALAAYTAGEVVERCDDPMAVADDLAALLTDPEPAVRRWAARSLGRLAAVAPSAVARHVESLGVQLRTDDRTTAVYLARALARLAKRQPCALEPALEPLFDALVSPRYVVGYLARDALVRVPPEILTTVPDIGGRLRAGLEADRDVLDGGTLVTLLAMSDPTVLQGHVDAVIEAAHSNAAPALARLAAVDPDAVAPHEDTVADWNKAAAQRTLARLGSEHYPETVDERLPDRSGRVSEADRDTVRAELEPLTEFLVATTSSEGRAAALEAVAPVTAAAPSLGAEVLTALVGRLDAADPGPRQHAAAAVAEAVRTLTLPDAAGLLGGTALPALLAAASDDDWAVRSQAVRAVGAVLETTPEAATEFGDPEQLVEGLVARLGDEHDWTRRHAANALARLPATVRWSTEVPRRLYALGGEPGAAARGATLALAAVTVADSTHGAGLDRIADGLDTSDPWVRRNALQGVRRVVADARDSHDDERVAALVADCSGPLPLRDRVRALAGADNPAVRAAACRCLGETGTAAARPLLEERTADSASEVTEAATEALDRLDERGV
jgi:HEAT repeat protein